MISKKVIIKVTAIISKSCMQYRNISIIIYINISLTVKAASLIFISGCGSAISSAKEGKSGFIYNLVKSL